ncbi:choice-of-anchor Q domain-containing protein [Chloroflexus sp.]|uniref:choice-of-anchor Q domain-containing protein n=1 Tax=Chloroflexus sp. TaxID=1904827 RepID=UPI002ACE8F53|nr:choice-of-anchor Q domain-containing protein [Chloroflexus sp.]
MTIRSFRQWLLMLLGVMLIGGANVAPIQAVSGRCYVKWNALGANNGTAWIDAYNDLQSALANLACNEIWVAAGFYQPGLSQNDSFILRNNVAIYGGFAGVESSLSERNLASNRTVLSGDIDNNDTFNSNSIVTAINGTNSYNVVKATNVNNTAILDGLTITGGSAVGFSLDSAKGGGIRLYDSSPVLNNLIIGGNAAAIGGGLANEFGFPVLTNVIFRQNNAQTGGGMANIAGSATLFNVTFQGNRAQRGGGMANLNSETTLSNTTFSGNDATVDAASDGGGMYNSLSAVYLKNATFFSNNANRDGGGMFNTDSTIILEDVSFSLNVAVNWGGGVFSRNLTTALTNVTFYANVADYGGGVFVQSVGGTWINATFSQNSATRYGGGIYAYSNSNPVMINITVTGNEAGNNGGGMYNDSSSNPSLTNAIIWGNRAATGGGIYNFASNPSITFSNVQGCFTSGTWNGLCGTDNGNNMQLDPLLGPLTNNSGSTQTHALQQGSPAINSGWCGLINVTDQRGVRRPQGGACDMGAVEMVFLYVPLAQR